MNQPDEQEPIQTDQVKVREAINEQKGRDIATPKSIEEQVDQLDEGTEEHRRRDPIESARHQHSAS